MWDLHKMELVATEKRHQGGGGADGEAQPSLMELHTYLSLSLSLSLSGLPYYRSTSTAQQTVYSKPGAVVGHETAGA